MTISENWRLRIRVVQSGPLEAGVLTNLTMKPSAATKIERDAFR